METPPTKQQKWKRRHVRGNYSGGNAIAGGGMTAYAKGTRGKPAPLGKPIIVGDPQADGKPNPEVVVATKRGVHVTPMRDMPMKARKGMKQMPCYAYGTGRYFNPNAGFSSLPRPTVFKPRVIDSMSGQTIQNEGNFLPTERPSMMVPRLPANDFGAGMIGGPPSSSTMTVGRPPLRRPQFGVGVMRG